jgi:hypothetical protein
MAQKSWQRHSLVESPSSFSQVANFLKERAHFGLVDEIAVSLITPALLPMGRMLTDNALEKSSRL